MGLHRFGYALAPLVFLVTLAATANSQTTYSTKLTTGPFLIASEAAAVDWAVVNNNDVPADLRVTVYRLDLQGAKVAIPAASFSFQLAPGRTVHSAWATGLVYFVGFYYEVVVESTASLVHPNVSQWSNSSGALLPGTMIPAASFVEIKTLLPLRFSRP